MMGGIAPPMPASSTLDPTAAEALLRERYGLRASARPLPSYADTNFRIDVGRESYVLRIAHVGEELAALLFQHRLLERLERAGIRAPRVVPAHGGGDVETLETAEGPRLVRLHTWVPGVPLAELAEPPLALLEELGALLGRIDGALADVERPDYAREFPWDPHRAGAAREHLDAISDRDGRRRVADVLDRFEAELLPRFEHMAQGVIHNDANDHNVLVSPGHEGRSPAIAGLTDFGDALHAPLVVEPALAATYAMLARRDPLARALAVLRGYLGEQPLVEVDLELFFALVETRLAVSVATSAAARSRRPDDAYLAVTEPHAWRLLAWFERERAQELRRAAVMLLEVSR